MTSVATSLPLTETVAPADQAELIDVVRRAYETETPLYPLGGGTAQQYGLTARQAGLGVSLARVSKVVDYPAADMTITVESGIRMSALAEQLSAHQQRLPIDVPQAAEATLGGVIATNFSGPFRYGHGTIRDYVIGISAVDGRGTSFKGGGRVVKNVAGYDFCKLLTGSLGTLAIISQITLKLKPRPAASAWLACDVVDFDEAESLLAALVNTRTMPVAIELLTGPAWQDDPALGSLDKSCCARLAVGVEGSRDEVAWMLGQLASEWQEPGIEAPITLEADAAAAFHQRLVDFSIPAEAPLVVKLNVRPSATCDMMQLLKGLDRRVSIQAHAGNGIVLARFSEFSPADAARLLIRELQPAAIAAGGQAVVWSCPASDELTRQAIWGATRSDFGMMRAVKQQFDPKNLLNPGRFVYGTL
jgi:glycolate oxidase FAD binding subunit